MSSKIEQQYEFAMDSLTPKQRVARSTAMLKWTREMIARQILSEVGPMSDERLKLEVAKRLYCGRSMTTAMIDRMLANVSD
ncbi:MAG: hypothetical protein ACI9G1_005037 [Pirellulaceae bacterium]|jgi:hypothetical protein